MLICLSAELHVVNELMFFTIYTVIIDSVCLAMVRSIKNDQKANSWLVHHLLVSVRTCLTLCKYCIKKMNVLLSILLKRIVIIVVLVVTILNNNTSYR